MQLRLFTLLILVVAALAYPVEPEQPKYFEAENKVEAVQAKDLESSETSKLKSGAPEDDLKTDASIWGWGGFYQPYYTTYYYYPWSYYSGHNYYGYGGYSGYGGYDGYDGFDGYDD